MQAYSFKRLMQLISIKKHYFLIKYMLIEIKNDILHTDFTCIVINLKSVNVIIFI